MPSNKEDDVIRDQLKRNQGITLLVTDNAERKPMNLSAYLAISTIKSHPEVHLGSRSLLEDS